MSEKQAELREQAQYLRDSMGITTVDKAVDFMRGWLPTQVFAHGVMNGKSASVMLMCAILGEAIKPEKNRQIAMSEATDGWDVYWELKEQSLI